eukprot:364175-Chlamydomonas_euryale.AAC.9
MCQQGPLVPGAALTPALERYPDERPGAALARLLPWSGTLPGGRRRLRCDEACQLPVCLS